MKPNYSSSNDFKLYIWDDFYTDYTNGIAVAIARSLEEAKALVEKEHGGSYYLDCWGDYYTAPLNKPFAVRCTGGG